MVQVSALTLIPITRIRMMKTFLKEDLDFLDSPCPQVVVLDKVEVGPTTVLWWVDLPPPPMKQLVPITTSRASRRRSRSHHPRQTGAHKIRINSGTI